MNDKNQRVFMAIAIWLALYFGYMTFFGPRKPAQGKTPVASPSAAVTGAPAGTAPGDGAAAPQPAAPAAPAIVPRGTTQAPLRMVTLQTPRATYVVSSQGAAFSSVQLIGEKWTRHQAGQPEAQVDLVGPRSGEALPFATQLAGGDGKPLIATDASYELVSQDKTSVTFRTEAGGNVLTKTLSVDPASYAVKLAVKVQAAAGFQGQLAVAFGRHAEEPKGGLFASRGNVPARALCVSQADGSKRVAVGDKHPEYEQPLASFAGIDEQYFLMAAQGQGAGCKLLTQGEKSGSITAFVTQPVQGSRDYDFLGYAGPKDKDDLLAVSPVFGESIDWGKLEVIAKLLLGVMRFFQRVVPGHNWGVSIILLTLAMKAVTFPLQHKSMKSMQEMQRIQPQLEEMKKKFAGDTQRQNLEQMKLFKEHGVNPMGSCLPMVIQMPIWFALYTTLQVSVDLYNAPFIPGWLMDLTAKDPYYVLPVAMGITMILTQVLTPSPMGNQSQKTMGYVMSGFFSLLMLSLPSGLTLYIFTNNLLSIAQQMYLRRTLKVAPAGAQTVTISGGGGR